MSYQRDERMEEFLRYDKAKIRKVRMFRTCLTSDGFEEYVAGYYQAVHGIHTIVRGGFDDEGIDVEGERFLNGRKTKLLIQCKRWSGVSTDNGDWYVKKPDVAEFYGNVADIRHSSDCEVRLVYATTAYFTTKAQEFCKEKRIEMMNYMDLLKMDKYHPLEHFIEQRVRGGAGFDKTFDLPQLIRHLPIYADIETEIKEVRKQTVDQFEILQREIETMDNAETSVPEPRIIQTNAVLVSRQTPQESPAPEIPSTKREVDADKLLRSVLMGVVVLLTAFIVLVAIAIVLQRSAIATLPRPSVPTYYLPFQDAAVQKKKKNRPTVRKKNIHVTATGGLR